MRSFIISVVTGGFALLALSASQSDATADIANPAQSNGDRSYVVFFENNQVTLTPEGREIVKAAADRARRSHAALITVSAPETRVRAGYNPAAAQPRLSLVRRVLIADGVRSEDVARATVSTDAHMPLVGVERVEIRVLANAQKSNS